jgi:V-type H+-transporting ATPase subunit F
MGERSLKGATNFLIVDKEMLDSTIETTLRGFLERDDIGIVMIAQNVAERVRNIIVEHSKAIPTILEMPAKEVPYEADKDTVVMRAACILWGADTGIEKLKEMTLAANRT